MIRAVLLIPFALAVILVIPALIGVYVYRDARRRRMNAALWTIIAVAAPSLIGFIIYLLVRGNHSDLECPRCGTAVARDYIICPGCGVKLRRVCPNCSAPAEPDWIACPRCAAPLPAAADDTAVPVQRQDKALWKLLAVIVAVPVLLIVFLSLSFARTAHGGTASMRQISFDEYFEGQTSEAALEGVQDWLFEIMPREEANHAYVLQYASDSEDGGYSMLIYVPGGGDSPHSSFGHSSGLFGPSMTLELERTGRSDSLYWVSISTGTAPRINVLLSGKKLPCEVYAASFDPALPPET